MKTLLIAAASGTALLFSGGSALALQYTGQDQERQSMFDRADIDGDGVITPAERETAKLELFSKMDTDGNGFVTEAEMTAAREASQQKREEWAAGRLGERSGKWVDRIASRQENKPDPMDRLDTDGDGAISQAEFMSMEPPHLDKVDANGDGNITRAEADAAREAMRTTMKERWQERRNGNTDQ